MNTEIDAPKDRSSKWFALLLLVLAIELIFFKFVPDLGTATLPNQGPSLLTDIHAFQDYYQTPNSVMYPRFAGTSILLWLARFIGNHVHSTDVRLYPLRIAAGILTPLYAMIGLIPVLRCRTRYRWQTYTTLYGIYCALGLYVFYPYDMPSIALISIAAFLILEEQLGPALVVMTLTGIFRESSLHIVWFVFAWAWCRPTPAPSKRWGWCALYLAVFGLEYLLVHRFYPGHTAADWDLHDVFFGRGLWSFTCIVTLSLVAIVPLYTVVRVKSQASPDWRSKFFLMNCASTPFWILFYRFVGGNISELRMLLPVVLPLFYGIALDPNFADPVKAADASASDTAEIPEPVVTPPTLP